MKFSRVVYIQFFCFKNANPSFNKIHVENNYFPLPSKFKMIALVVVENMSIVEFLGIRIPRPDNVKGTLMVMILFTIYLKSFASESKTYKTIKTII
jgi:hypothetical protein